MILNIIRQTIREYNLFDEGDRVLVGLSGGADSVCLTYALHTLRDELGIELFAAHLNHGIRGDEAKRDSRFAADFAASLGIKCFTGEADTPRIAKETGQSEETAARRARYGFFEQISSENGINKIATAHNKNDNAETILMNFMRGSSLSGLSGIPYKRGNIVRPLLDIARADIEKYCADNGLEFVTDSTNLTDDYTRNKIRHMLLPAIEKDFNRNFIETVTANSQLIYDEDVLLAELAKSAYCEVVKENKIAIAKLCAYELPIQRRIIRDYLKRMYGTLDGISAGFIADIISLANKQSGRSINLPNGIVVKNEYGYIVIVNEPKPAVEFEYTIPIGGKCVISEINKLVTVTETNKREPAPNAVYLSIPEADSVTVRTRRSGDRFCPSGMKGTKKVKEYLIDSKIPQDKRCKIPIIEINGRIAAVGGRVDDSCLFKDKGIRIDFKNV